MGGGHRDRVWGHRDMGANTWRGGDRAGRDWMRIQGWGYGDGNTGMGGLD